MKKIFTLCMAVTMAAAALAQTPKPRQDSLTASASHYLNSLNKDYDPVKALELFKMSAARGNAQSMYAVAMQYRFGIGTKPNPREALVWFTRAADAGHGGAWAAIAMIYKDGDGVPIDYAKAYDYFAKGAAANDPQGMYGQGYMLYKGLGVAQDYTRAVALFAAGAARGKNNSMYFLGLCFRNGYGITANADSATYWLDKAAKHGYKVAGDELAIKEPENAGVAEQLVDRIRSAQEAMGQDLTINQYNKVENKVDAGGIEGRYSGFLLHYDYSGKHLVGVNKLDIELKYTKDSLNGRWIEDDSISVPLRAKLTPQALVFSQTSYWKRDHYSGASSRLYSFQQARLQLVRKDTSVYLSGNVEMFAEQTREPAKPFFIVLTRVSAVAGDKRALSADEEGLSGMNNLHAYPNPFSSMITVNFELKERAKVSTQLLTLNGEIIYINNGGDLEPGTYSLPIQPGQIPAGMYMVKLSYGAKEKTIKVIKL